jgi:hypothetical protein
MSIRRLTLPSLSAWLWLLFFLGLTLSNWRLVLINADGDPCLHRRLGNWMIEHRTILREDLFSHTRPQAPVITKEWLSEVVFAAVERTLGWNGAGLIAAALMATVLWLLHRWLLVEHCDPLIATGLVLLTALASSNHWIARPHLITYLLTVIFAWQLRAFDRNRSSVKQLLVLVPLMTLWANLHGAFFTGFVLMGIYAIGNLADPRKARTFAWLGIACLAASLINPNGWRLHIHILQFLGEPTIATFANEFRSPNFHSAAMRGFLLLWFVIGMLLLVVRPQWRLTDMLLVSVWGFFALDAVRNVAIFAIVVTPVLAEHWQAYWSQANKNAPFRLIHHLSANLPRPGPLIYDGVFAVAAIVAVLYLQASHRVATQLLSSRFPVKAIDWVHANPNAVQGEMFNDYGWGGYLLWALPERKVFIDGRNDFYGAPLMKEFNTVDNVEPEWNDVLNKYKVGWTILPPDRALNRVLALDPGWRLVYTDEVTTIYGRAQQHP